MATFAHSISTELFHLTNSKASDIWNSLRDNVHSLTL